MPALIGLFLLGLTLGIAPISGAANLSEEQFEKGKFIYFDRCSGCHGTLRKGATGPIITDEEMLKKELPELEEVLFEGTDAGMPGWGRTGELTEEETKLMARFIREPVPIPPEWGLAEMKNSHKLHVPVADRPTRPQHRRNIDDYFGFILRDAGKGAILDGEKKDLVGVVDTGFAVHIFRASATGRYFYTIGRDGKASLIDLYPKKPKIVAEVKVCDDLRGCLL